MFAETKDTEARSGLLVINIETGQTVEWLRFLHIIDEPYDVAVLSDTRQPEAIGFRGKEIRKTVCVEI